MKVRPKDMMRTELMALREVSPTDPSLRATWFEDDDPMLFGDEEDNAWRLHQTADGEWVRSRAN